MPGNMIGKVRFYAAQFGNGFQYLVAGRVAWHWEYLVVPCHAFVLFNDTFRNIQQTNIRFGVGLLSSGDNPKVAVKECLQVVFREVLNIGVCQSCKGGEQE